MSAEAEDTQARLRRTQRLVFRYLSEFLVEEVGRLARRHDGDFVEAATFLAISQTSRPSPGGRPAHGVSVRALAISMGQPFETTRRKVAALEAAGLCARFDDTGFGATPAAFADPRWQADCRASREALKRLLEDLRAAGVDIDRGEAVRSPPHPYSDQETAEIIATHVGDCLLRMLEYGAPVWGSMVSCAVAVALIAMNAEPFTRDPVLAASYAGADTPPPDVLRRPVSAADISNRIGISYDIVNRRLRGFVENGWAQRMRGGYLSAMSRQQQPEVLQSGLLAGQRFFQMMQQLRLLGIDPTA